MQINRRAIYPAVHNRSHRSHRPHRLYSECSRIGEAVTLYNSHAAPVPLFGNPGIIPRRIGQAPSGRITSVEVLANAGAGIDEHAVFPEPVREPGRSDVVEDVRAQASEPDRHALFGKAAFALFHHLKR